ncbi:hypothetical protein FB45DRAFT_1008290 [Roridomyces roridus]|uniref:GPI anchored protein n=1 Tax=Roridomyces roridus TaxID=1738132 RepID=A0AAD7BAI2_9AGAR|nr:hypothetical protein FB45DRAFT_1008290 [Roridomyces roridus]
MLHLLVSLLALEGAHAAVTLVQPAPTSLPSFSGVSSSISATASFAVSVGGVASADGATTYVLEEILGLDGSTTTIGRTFAQGATVWREDDTHETCSLDGNGKAVCSLGVAGFETGFTGTAIPIITVGSDGQVQGGGPGAANPSATASRSGDGGSGSSGGGSSGGSAGGGAIGLDSRASLGWGVVVSIGAAVAAMRVLF